MRTVQILSTFSRHPIDTGALLERIGEEYPEVVINPDIYWIDGRESLDFSEPDYLKDAWERAQKALRNLPEADIYVLVPTGFNPTAWWTVARLSTDFAEDYMTSGHLPPDLWGAHSITQSNNRSNLYWYFLLNASRFS